MQSEGVLLTPLSPLTDRTKLCHSPAIDTVADALSRYGFQAGWRETGLQVSPTAASKLPAEHPALTIDVFMGGLTRTRQAAPGTYRPKVTSSVRFQKLGGAASLKMASASCPPGPTTSGSQSGSRPGTPQLIHTVSGQGAQRASRLAQSVDSLQQLQVPTGGNINTVNLISMQRPASSSGRGWHSYSASKVLAMSAPLTMPAPTLSGGLPTDHPHPCTSSTSRMMQRPATAAQQADQHADGVATTSNSNSSLQRPATATVDLGQGASESLRPSTAAALRPSTACSRHSMSSYRPRGTPRLNPTMAEFRPTRGHSLVVFQHMDKDQNGKVTLSELEDICLALGFTIEQTHKMFQRMDRDSKGFLRSLDWGSKEVARLVELFTLLYMQKFMGLPGPQAQPEQVQKYFHEQDIKSVKSMAAAIHMARTNALMRGAHSASSSGNVIFESFRFMDTDGSGKLTFDELRDGFYALGVYVQDEALQQIVRAFDADGDGAINFDEFCQKLFPGAARGHR